MLGGIPDTARISLERKNAAHVGAVLLFQLPSQRNLIKTDHTIMVGFSLYSPATINHATRNVT